ncbi:MAG: hypothetical protein U0992_12515 [Planctomycetaceae bacterium]
MIFHGAGDNRVALNQVDVLGAFAAEVGLLGVVADGRLLGDFDPRVGLISGAEIEIGEPAQQQADGQATDQRFPDRERELDDVDRLGSLRRADAERGEVDVGLGFGHGEGEDSGFRIRDSGTDDGARNRIGRQCAVSQEPDRLL